MTTPKLKKYYLQYVNPPYNESIELFIFPEDLKSTTETKYSKLNQYGIYPYLNLRTHNVTVRYSNRFLLDKIEKIAIHAVDTGVPIKFGSSADYAARHNNAIPPVDPTIQTTGNETTTQLLELDRVKNTALEEYEFGLDANLKPFEGFIDLPFESVGLIGKGASTEGFSFSVTEVTNHFRSILVGCLTMRIPPDSYSYTEENVMQGSIQYGTGNFIIKTPSYVRKGFSINLPSCYADVYQTLKRYREDGKVGGVDILDNVGNAFNGRGYVTAVSPNGGAISRKVGDNNPNAFLPNGISFTVLSIEPFMVV